jgi:2-polyprenyl-3-methyl-5-hydroxy-6-metoxy-1,4-benzoquinol methylase
MEKTVAENPAFEEQQEYWDERWNRQRLPNDWQRRRGQTILDLARGLSMKNPKILDLGCATGWFTAQLSRFWPDVTGIDLSEAAIELAKHDFPGIRYIAGNIFEMDVPAQMMDLVVCQEVIAHVPDQSDLVKRIARIIKPGGHLIISTANKFVIDRWDMGPDPKSHIKQWLTMRTFKALLEPQFRILKTCSIIPIGEQGILQFINSHRLNTLLRSFLSDDQIERAKEKAGLGYSLIALTQKK